MVDPAGLAIQRLRVERGITQEALGFKSGVKIATLSRIERGETEPKIGALRKIADALGVSLADLVAMTETREEKVNKWIMSA